MASIGGVSPLSLLTFFAAAKKVSPAPDRGNACAPARPRGCRESVKTKNEPLHSKTQHTMCPHKTNIRRNRAAWLYRAGDSNGCRSGQKNKCDPAISTTRQSSFEARLDRAVLICDQVPARFRLPRRGRHGFPKNACRRRCLRGEQDVLFRRAEVLSEVVLHARRPIP